MTSHKPINKRTNIELENNNKIISKNRKKCRKEKKNVRSIGI